MKPTNTVRKFDQMGRLVLPSKTRRELGIEEGTELEIFVDEDTIILKKYIPGCIFCSSVNTINYKFKKICPECLKDLKHS
jgi:transcriptional pleiotropic regulator of transition state genes